VSWIMSGGVDWDIKGGFAYWEEELERFEIK